MRTEGFRFGIEAEFLLADRREWRPLWYQDVSFQHLNAILEGIDLDGIPSLEGLELEHPHKKLMPYVVEGYHLPEQDAHAGDILPKGLEIRTPICSSLDECLNVYQTLHRRLEDALRPHDLALVALSHHPLHTRFRGPQNKRRHDFWLWAMEVMTTYGPDINVSFPKEVESEWDNDDMLAKINFYGPAMTAFSVASPFCEGGTWKTRDRVGKSFRTYRRSVIAPPIEVHPEEKGRMEFKVFEMANSLTDFRNQFLLFLALVLDKSLTGRALDADRIYQMGEVARLGFDAEGIREKAATMLASARRVLPAWGFEVSSLEAWEKRLQDNRTPADDMLDLFRKTWSLRAILENRSILTP